MSSKWLSDQAALDQLVKNLGSDADTARTLGISAERLANWRRRGISNQGRPMVWRQLRVFIDLPGEWAFARQHDHSGRSRAARNRGRRTT